MSLTQETRDAIEEAIVAVVRGFDAETGIYFGCISIGIHEHPNYTTAQGNQVNGLCDYTFDSRLHNPKDRATVKEFLSRLAKATSHFGCEHAASYEFREKATSKGDTFLPDFKKPAKITFSFWIR